MSRRVNTSVLRTVGLAVCAAVLSLAPGAFAQTTVVIDDPRMQVADARIEGGRQANKVFQDERLATKVHPTDPTYTRRSVLKFDTHNTVPAGATVQSAKLTLTLSKASREARNLRIYRLSHTFHEQYATWYGRKGGLRWITAGGGLAEKWAETSVGSRAGSKITFDVTALVQRVVNGGFGPVRWTRIALVDAGRGSEDSYKEFYSSEARDASARPALTVVYGGSSNKGPGSSRPTPTIPPPTKPAPPKPAPVTPTPVTPPDHDDDNDDDGNDNSGSTSRVKMLDWNTHYGVGTDGRYNIDRIAAQIAKFDPDIVSLNEVTRYAYYNSREDQASRYAALLKAKTGRTWYYHYKTDNGASRGVGNLVLSRFPIASTSSCQLSGRRVAVHAAVYVNGRLLNVWSTHLDSSTGSSRRIAEVRALTACLSNFSQQRIVAGDFNARDFTSEIGMMESGYYDAWAEAASDRTAVDYPGNSAFGATRNRRIDYIWYSKGANFLKLKGARVFDTRDARGYRPSDHKPVLAIFDVK